MARDSGIPASKRLGIRDEVLAFDFDRAVSLRLLRFDNERAKEKAKLIGKYVGLAINGGEDPDIDVLDATELHEFIKNDPYANKDTIVN